MTIEDDVKTVREALWRLDLELLEFSPDDRLGFEDGQGRSVRAVAEVALDRISQALEEREKALGEEAGPVGSVGHLGVTGHPGAVHVTVHGSTYEDDVAQRVRDELQAIAQDALNLKREEGGTALDRILAERDGLKAANELLANSLQLSAYADKDILARIAALEAELDSCRQWFEDFTEHGDPRHADERLSSLSALSPKDTG